MTDEEKQSTMIERRDEFYICREVDVGVETADNYYIAKKKSLKVREDIIEREDIGTSPSAEEIEK